jgi:hypothetical protein
MSTPTSPEGLRRYDGLPPVEAVVRAWTEPGPRPDWHERMRREVQSTMPLLARALDRLADAGPGRDDDLARAHGLIRTLYLAGLEYVASSRYGGWDEPASVSGYDAHGNTNLSAEQEDLLRQIMGMADPRDEV